MRVERLEKVIAMVWPVRALAWVFSGEPDLRRRLWVEALRTRVVSSLGVRSAMERRWRGAKGEVCGVDAGDGEDE